MNKKLHPADGECRMNYIVYYPDDYKDLPLLVYLHGAGERGLNADHITAHGVAEMAERGDDIKAVVLCPQCPAESVWDNIVDEVKAIIDKTAAEYDIKPDRICITGSSMGGYGTFAMVMAYANFFSAMGPVAGGSMGWRAAKLKATPAYIMHGTDDTSVEPVYSEIMAKSINEKGGCAKLLMIEGKGHNDGIDYAYENTDLIEWLLAQRRTDFSRVKEPLEEMF